MHYHPGGIDAQEHQAKGATYSPSEDADYHGQCEYDGERHIQEENEAVMQYPLPE